MNIPPDAMKRRAQAMPQGKPPMQGQPPAEPGAMPPEPDNQQAEMNPIMEAIQTLAQWIAAQKEKGNPKAAPLMEWLRQGIEMIAGKGEGEPPQEGVSRETKQSPDQGKPMPMQRSMNANEKSSQVL